MFKLLTLILLFTLTISQQNIKIVTSLDAFFEEKKEAFYFLYEIKSDIDSRHSSYWGFTNYEDEFALHDLKSDPNNSLILIKYDPIENNILMTSTIGIEGKSYINKNSLIVFAGLQSNQDGYRFIKELISRGHKNLASLLADHDKNQALSDYKKIYLNANSNDEKKNILYWASRIKSDESFDFINSKFESENNDLRKEMLFCFRNFGKKGYRKLLSVVKTGNSSSRNEARFWIVNSASKELEKSFSDKIYSKDSITLKESAIFSLYNQNDITALKRIAKNSKDIRLRKKALFWLGQSKAVDIDFFASMLNL